MSYYRLPSKETRKQCGVTWSGKSNSRSKPVSRNESSPSRLASAHRHTRESGYPEVFEFSGFRVALPPEEDQPEAEAIASLPGMTPILFNGFWETPTSSFDTSGWRKS